MASETAAPEVLMFLASGCTHCPAVLNHLTEMLKGGQISQLTAINISSNPQLAEPYNVRSVPWIKIGEFELTGAHSKQELLHWIEQAANAQGMADYYAELLNTGELHSAIDHLKKHPQNLAQLLSLMQDPQIKISVQIGIGAIMEDFANTESLRALVPELIKLTRHELPRVRNDACHFLSLSGDAMVIEPIKALLDDADAEVRETAQDCLQELG